MTPTPPADDEAPKKKPSERIREIYKEIRPGFVDVWDARLESLIRYLDEQAR